MPAGTSDGRDINVFEVRRYFVTDLSELALDWSLLSWRLSASATTIRKKWLDGEPVLSVETEDEFWKALTTSEAVELTWELGEKIGLMEDDTMSALPRNNRTTPTPRIAAIS